VLVLLLGGSQFAAFAIEVLEQVTNARDYEILRRRYLLGQRWEEIAVEMHYKYQHVCRCHRAAVTKLVIECDT